MVLSIIALVVAIANVFLSVWLNQRTRQQIREYRADMAVLEAIKRGAQREALYDIYELHGVDDARDRVAFYWQHYGPAQ